jgi:pimeloyl-ACP methyl ester carboxylesterase
MRGEEQPFGRLWRRPLQAFAVLFIAVALSSGSAAAQDDCGGAGTRFAQTVPPAEVDAMYDRYIVPTPGKVYWDGLILAAGKIRWDNPDRAPLLLIGGGIDLIAEAKMTEAMFEKQKRAPSKTELKIYPDRSHWTCTEPGWEEVADFALDWAGKNVRAQTRGAEV